MDIREISDIICTNYFLLQRMLELKIRFQRDLKQFNIALFFLEKYRVLLHNFAATGTKHKFNR